MMTVSDLAAVTGLDERYFVLRLYGLHHSRHELLG
jgi:hypothetical protein